MSYEITTAFVQQYGRNVQILSQQMGSKFRNAVMIKETDSEYCYFDQIGAVTAQDITTRHGDTPILSTPHSRRRVAPTGAEWGDLIDDEDQVKMLIDPTSSYAVNGAYALGRKMDDRIIAAFFGTSATGKDGSTSTTFPSANQVAVNLSGSNEGLTVNKVLRARKLLQDGDVDLDNPMNKLYIACAPEQLEEMLQTTQVTSADYNSIKALVAGQINTFLGMEWIVTTRLAVDTNSYRRVPVWAKSGMGLAIGRDISTRIAERPDKRFSTQVYCAMTVGATRIEEAKVIEIKCAEGT